MVAEVVFIIDSRRERELVGRRVRHDTGVRKTRNGNLSFLELSTKRAE
jgi:hypothetical protein